ncbi:MAG: EAL domain-containing protein [Thermoanaerobaculia bacterium]
MIHSFRSPAEPPSPAPRTPHDRDPWFRALAETTSTAIFVYSDRVLYVNPATEELTGYTAGELLAQPPWFVAHPDHQPLIRDRVRARLAGEPLPARYEFKILTKDGRERWVDATSAVIELDDVGPAAMATAVDITERKLAEESLRETNARLEKAQEAAQESEERLRAMVEALAQEKELAQITLASIGDGVIRTDAAGIVDYLNPVAERLTGWSSAEACGQPVGQVFNVMDETTGKALPNPVERCLHEGDVVELPGYSLLTRRDGRDTRDGRDARDVAIRDSAAPIRDALGRIAGCVLVFKDVTQLRGMEREMIYLARHDPLTGLINRREFEKRLQHCLASAHDEARLHALFYLDLDEFKVVNDTCGHLAGDEMLKQVTGLLRSRLRKSDTLARLGGDEFGVLLEDTPLEDARTVGDSLRTEVKRFRFAWQERIFEIGVSIGLVPITGESLDIAQVLSAADAACYVAKESGRNRMHEYQPDDSAVAERYGEMQWIHRIQRALEEKRFRLFYQLIQPLGVEHTGRELLCEIFLRMLDPNGTVIEPSAFLSAAERYHLIGELDRWVVHTAFRALAEAQRREVSRPVLFALNVSAQSLADETFLFYVLEQIEESLVDPRRLCFEITETAAISKLDSAIRFISALKVKGCRFILDDFGSGLSSFAYLKDLSMDFLKIDGEFVQNMVEDRVKRAMVESINQIGHVMGLQTIAEWVENRQTLEFLKELGVDYAQGYWLCRPQPLVHDS